MGFLDQLIRKPASFPEVPRDIVEAARTCAEDNRKAAKLTA
jgi:hypothetical protein